MLRVNKILIRRIFVRTLISLTLCATTLLLTGRIADSKGYLGLHKFTAFGDRTDFATAIFKILPNFGSIIFPVFLLSTISSTIIYLSLNKYIIKKNLFDWFLLLYLPSLLIYVSIPSKEVLFFIPALIYILIESEYLIKGKVGNSYNLFKYIAKISILTFMVKVRGLLALPYVLLAIWVFLFKSFNLNTLKIRTLNFSVLILYSSIISLFLLVITDKTFIFENLNRINSYFGNNQSILSNRYDISLINNIYNPFNFIKIQFTAAFPSIEAIWKKPYTLLITYESMIFFYLFFKFWSKLFLVISKDNKANIFFSIIFVLITCCYFLIYGILGYGNIGTSQRFRANFIPIGLIFPNITECILYKNKKEVNSISKQSY